MLVNIPRLITAYYTEVPDSSMLEQRVSFGTSVIAVRLSKTRPLFAQEFAKDLGFIGFQLNEARNAGSNECDFPRTPAGSQSASSARTKN